MEDCATKKTKGNTIQLHILNRSFNYTASIKKTMYWVYFLLGERPTDTVYTKYNILT